MLFSILNDIRQIRLFIYLFCLSYKNSKIVSFLGCERLYAEQRANNYDNNSDSMDPCICTDDIYSKADVWQAVTTFTLKCYNNRNICLKHITYIEY